MEKAGGSVKVTLPVKEKAPQGPSRAELYAKAEAEKAAKAEKEGPKGEKAAKPAKAPKAEKPAKE